MQISSVARLSRFLLAGAAALVGFVLCTTVLGSSSQAAVGPVEGTLDESFGDGGITKTHIFGHLQQARVLANDEIVVVGLAEDLRDECHPIPFSLVDCTYVTQIAHLSPNGMLDERYGISGFVVITAPAWQVESLPKVEIKTDGQIRVIALTQTLQFDAMGQPDRSFGNSGVLSYPVASTAPGTILPEIIDLPSGEFMINFYDVLARFRSNGTLDPSFGNQGLFDQRLGLYRCQIIALPNGKYLVGGRTGSWLNQNYEPMIFRLMPNGTLDPSFNNILGPRIKSANGTNQPTVGGVRYCPIVHPNGNLIIADINLSQYGVQSSIGLFTADGLLLARPPGIPLSPQADILQLSVERFENDGKILVVGKTLAGVAFHSRFNSNFTLDKSYGQNGVLTQTIQAQTIDNAIQLDGRKLRILPQSTDTLSRSIQIARYLTNNTPDPSFNGGSTNLVITDTFTSISGTVVVSDSYASALGLQEHGDIIVGGTYYVGHTPTSSGSPYLLLARLHGTPVTILRTYLPIVPVTR